MYVHMYNKSQQLCFFGHFVNKHQALYSAKFISKGTASVEAVKHHDMMDIAQSKFKVWIPD